MVNKPDINNFSNHVVICNCNEKVKGIVEEIQSGVASELLDIILLVQDKKLWDNNPQWHPEITATAKFVVIYGSPFDLKILEKASIKKAKAAIILADPLHGQLADAQSTLMAVAIEKENPQVHTVQELILSINRNHLKAMNVDEVVCLGEISEKLIAQSCISPGIKNVFENILTTEKGTPQIFLPQLTPEFNGYSFRKLSRIFIANDAPFIAAGYIISIPEITRERGTSNRISNTFVLNPKKQAKDMPLSQNDKLIIIAYSPPDKIEEYLL